MKQGIAGYKGGKTLGLEILLCLHLYWDYLVALLNEKVYLAP